MFPLSVSRDNLKEAIEMMVRKIFFPCFLGFPSLLRHRATGWAVPTGWFLVGKSVGASQCVRAAPDKAENGLPDAA